MQEEQAVLEKIVRDRRASLAPPPQMGGSSPGTPHILVSGASNQELGEPYFLEVPRRASTQSMGPVVVPVCSLWDSKNTPNWEMVTWLWAWIVSSINSLYLSAFTHLPVTVTVHILINAFETCVIMSVLKLDRFSSFYRLCITNYRYVGMLFDFWPIVIGMGKRRVTPFCASF